MRRIHVWLVVALLVLSWGGAAWAQETFITFDEFVGDVSAASFDSYAVRPESGLEQKPEFEKMRQHILALYEGVKVPHSFVMDSQYFDCIPVEQQPSVRLLGLKGVLTPPDPLPDLKEADASRGHARRLPAPLTLGLVDQFGNAVSCDEGTIPVRRVTLEEMSRFGSLEGFFRKSPYGGGKPASLEGPLTAASHKYAHAYQTVNNLGGNSWLNLWRPPINRAASHIFSLSQHWYVGGSGSSLQTVEGGWQVYPDKYNTTNAVLFIYWTADGYNRTGCYNLDCAAFVQTNRKWTLGGGWANYSSSGGTQWEFQMQWKLTGGNWWLFLQGNGSYEAIGYYPGSIYRGGQLTRYATAIDYGGETVGSFSWPPMGSGAFAIQGFRLAAYQRLIYYIDTSSKSQWPALRVDQPSPRCYTLRYTSAAAGGAWKAYFYFGGPGGNSC